MITEQISTGWLTSLDVNAAFDRPWVDEAVAWIMATASGPVLDVGCGAGGAAAAFAHHADVVALDRDPRLLAVARRRAEAEKVDGRVRWATGEVGRLPVGAGTFGVVWASGVVHHVADQQAAVAELAALVRPGGTVALVEGGLPLRCLPHEIGLGRPGLEARLDEARARWFEDLRTELGGPPLPYGWPAALERAGLVDRRTRSFVAEAVPPLDEVGRAIALQHLTNGLEELGERLAADDRATLRRLVDPADEAWIGHRDDLVVTAVRTVHVATRPG
ncbi:MAG TPA: methyltransferase domain-containing protein [Acidimicrobiales bacterium]